MVCDNQRTHRKGSLHSSLELAMVSKPTYEKNTVEVVGNTAPMPFGKNGTQLPGCRWKRPTAQTRTMMAILMLVRTMLTLAPNSAPRASTSVRKSRRSGAMRLYYGLWFVGS